MQVKNVTVSGSIHHITLIPYVTVNITKCDMYDEDEDELIFMKL